MKLMMVMMMEKKVVPVVIGYLRSTPKGLEGNLMKIGSKMTTLPQKTVLLRSARILQRVHGLR